MTHKEIFLQSINVSRETLMLFEEYERLIVKWNNKINLISPKTIESLWSRHFLDSAQIFEMAPEQVKIWSDFGSGAGFPGLVCAILAKDKTNTQFYLVESDQRKSAFLMTVIRELGLKAVVLPKRIEAIAPLNADVISARALAPLNHLLDLSVPHLSPSGVFLFPKGSNWKEEISVAQNNWSFRVDTCNSLTDSEAVILKLEGVKHV